MGCDIHAYWEIKEKGKDGWTPFGYANIDRWYYPFTLMAGVRNYSNLTPISEAKGLPKDVTNVVKAISDGWDSDGHSHSWLSADELNRVVETVKENDEVDSKDMWLLIRSFRFDSYYDQSDFLNNDEDDRFGILSIIDDVRLVFWFDN